MRVIKVLMFLVCGMGYAQTISVNDTDNSALDLVNLLLDDACVQVSNVVSSSGESVAYFNNNQGNFPIEEGVVIRSGKAKFSEGSYTGNNLSSTVNTNTDAYLQDLTNSSGQSSFITDIASLQFDFVPLSSNFSFNFLFASNEYGEWQCISSDTFAFLLTDLSTGETTNLAVIPGTSTPISVQNIKDNQYNSSCGSDNPALFESYQVNNPETSSLNMRGYTVILNAGSEIIPGNSYRIKLVIGDSNDADYDSAIFLSAGSFSANVDLGDDRLLCQGDEAIIATGLDAGLYTHTWTHNNNLLSGETGNSITVGETGVYAVTVTKNGSNCFVNDEVVISDLQINAPVDISACNNGEDTHIYDLTQNNVEALGLDANSYEVSYFATQEDLDNNVEIPTEVLPEYPSPGNQTVYLRISNSDNGNYCETLFTFNLNVFEPVSLINPGDVEICIPPFSNSVNVNLAQVIPQIIAGQDADDFQIDFFLSSEDAEHGVNAIPSSSSFSIPASELMTTIFVRVEDLQSPGCYGIVEFQVILNTPPPVDSLPNVVACSEYVLPVITYGDFYTGQGGTGQLLNSGDIINETGTYFIYNGPDENGCASQTQFKVTLLDELELEEAYCGQFTVPVFPFGNFYSTPGGPDGVGEEISAGTVLYSSQIIYFYSEVDNELCTDKPLDVVVLPLPEIDVPADVVTCGSYALPPLENGNYFTQPNGGGTALFSGHLVDSSQTIYVYNNNGTCVNQASFTIDITPTFEDVEACGSYTLPNLSIGGYFTQPNGQGQNLDSGTTLISSQDVFYYAETTTAPNCTVNLKFNVEVIALPEVDTIEDITLCAGETYELPQLSNGQYFTEANRGGTELFPGFIVEETSTIFINNLEDGCSNESFFEIEIKALPPVDNFTDIYSCDPYQLPALTNGTYFTGPGATGEILHAGEFIDATQTIYIYNEWEDLNYCNNEDAFTVYIEGIHLGNFENVSACDLYVLPALSQGSYFSQSGGEGMELQAGHVVATSQEIFVYKKTGNRFICESEESFYVHISETPFLENFDDVEVCESYMLPTLSQEHYNQSYYWESGGNSPILDSEKNMETPGTYTVFVHASAKDNPACYSETQFNVTIYPLQELYVEGDVLCRNPETGEVDSPAVLITGLDASEFVVKWYLNNQLVYTGVEYDAMEAGIYTIKTEKVTTAVGADCNYKPTTVTVTESGKAKVQARITEPFADVAVITVDILNGYGNYEYKLNNGPFQSSNEFYDVPSGTHSITVRGTEGYCGNTIVEVEVLKFPKFFTPNGDGFNDIWNIKDLEDHPEAKIYIYDRYGKMITIIFPSGNGWDGTFHGEQLFSNDYWFRAVYEYEGVKKEFKSHFTLKR